MTREITARSMVEDEKGQDLSLAKVEKGYDIALLYRGVL